MNEEITSMKKTYDAGNLWDTLDYASRAIGAMTLYEENAKARENLEDIYSRLRFWLLELEELDGIEFVWKQPNAKEE